MSLHSKRWKCDICGEAYDDCECDEELEDEPEDDRYGADYEDDGSLD